MFFNLQVRCWYTRFISKGTSALFYLHHVYCCFYVCFFYNINVDAKASDSGISSRIYRGNECF